MKFFIKWEDIAAKSPIDGVRLRAVTGKNLQMVMFEIEPNTEIPLHSHPHEQIGTVIKGKLMLKIENEEKVVGPGDAYRVPSNIKHGAKTLDEKTIVIETFTPPRQEYK